PSPYDALEDFYTVSNGFGSSGIVGEVDPCSLAPPGVMVFRKRPSPMVFTATSAYHDMATYNISTGLGGLDGSITFETNRPENIGTAFNTTALFFAPLQTKLSDVLALGVILAIKNCAGPNIPFQPGRIDATKAGPFGVPQPQESLETHIAEFAHQGFNATEMIALVACGHTVGGIHQIDFPLSVTDAITTENPEGVVHFDDTFDVFDNQIATKYINGSSVDQLLVGFNAKTNSDARIFASDGNQTMLAFAQSNDAFLSRCGDLLGRMLDTVPASVQLGDVIEPLTVKPYELSLFFNTTGGLQLSGYIRVCSTFSLVALSRLTLIWTDRNGVTSPTYNTAAVSSTFLELTSIFGSVQLFSVSTFIDPAAGISAFIVDWAYSTGSALTTADNGGAGFPFQDVVLFQRVGSCHGDVNANSTINAVVRLLFHLTFQLTSQLSSTLDSKRHGQRLLRIPRIYICGHPRRFAHV
ncbi:heme peroxidase, partial [Mycena galopus ATCC 62051]